MERVDDLHIHSRCTDKNIYPPLGIVVKRVIIVEFSTLSISDHDKIIHVPLLSDYIKNINIYDYR